MNAITPPNRGDLARPELGPLLSVLFLMIDEVRSVVLHVTSARHGEGTTTIARDLATAAAAADWCKVALLDAHREPSGRAGLIEFVERGEQPVLLGSGRIAAGRLSGSPQPISRVDSVRALYSTLRKSYALIVVDCPPVLADPQTLVMAPAATETLLVIEAERTPAADVMRARAALEERGASLMGVVLNKSRARVPKVLARVL